MKKILMMVLAFTCLFSALTPAFAAPNAKFTTQEAIANYSKYMDNYVKHDQPIINQFRANDDGSFGHKLVDRAIWYLQNGYTVYGHVYKGYKDYGIVDCSNFVSLLYSDAGYDITTASRQYDSVGQQVAGVTSTKVNGLYRIQGVENLRPGDIFTFWEDVNGQRIIGHVAIYMGTFNGQPAILGTTANRPTALGIVNDFGYWYGEHFNDVRRVLPANDTSDTLKAPVIPASYVLPPQRAVQMPTDNAAAPQAAPAVAPTETAVTQQPVAQDNQSAVPDTQPVVQQQDTDYQAAPQLEQTTDSAWQPVDASQQAAWWQFISPWQPNY